MYVERISPCLSSKGRLASIACPRELRATLLDLYLCFLERKPKNVVDFALEYFKTMKVLWGNSKIGFTSIDEVKIQHLGMKNYFDKRRDGVCLESCELASDIHVAQNKKRSEKRKIRPILEHVLLFKTLDETTMDSLVESFSTIECDVGDIIIEEGEKNQFFIVDSGTFYSFKIENEKITVMKKISPGFYFGELSLFYDEPSRISVMAVTKGKLFALDREAFRNLILTRENKKYLSYKDYIESIDLFMMLTENERSILLEIVEIKSFDNGEVLFYEGEFGSGMYIVMRGKVDMVTTTTHGGRKSEVKLFSIYPGSYFGELSLVTPCRRLASARARGEVHTIFISSQAIKRVLEPCLRHMLDHLHKETDITNKIDVSLIDQFSL